MNPRIVITENWFTKPTRDSAYFSTFVLGILLSLVGYLYIHGNEPFQKTISASGHLVFQEAQYWRLWTTLFAHADFAHLLGNLVLLLPLSFVITSYFGVWVFPMLGLFVGGVINYVVLKTMPVSTGLIGISGVVYWMGSLWIVLFMLIDRRKSVRQRIALGLFFTVVLFIPETYKAEISYLSHFVGYVLGVISGGLIYVLYRKTFLAAEVKEYLYEGELDVLPIESPDDVLPPKSEI
ncbi:MAG: rhomboid family intramembrane serine protease [Bdellovibrionaceae bacterium]|nr:rhomboid family intramembrane serine protease [Pseudobdellovibrionaceae bacterium]